MLELLIGMIIVLFVGFYIFKGYSATGILLIGGITLLGITALMGNDVLPSKIATTGSLFTDVFEYVKYLLGYRAGGLGMMIMILCGFAGYMTHIGANDSLIKIASKPIKYAHSPYAVMIVVYFIACAMTFAVASATALGVLLMATFFPIMVNAGISKGAAAAICASPAALILTPTSGDVIVAASASGMELIPFAFQVTLPVSLFAVSGMAITHFVWQKHLDKKEGHDPEVLMEAKEFESSAPAWYAILPLLPIIGVILFSGKIFHQLNLVTIIVMCLFFSALIETIRQKFNIKEILVGLEVSYAAMADAFKGVVMLLIAAGVFAQGLKSVGFIDNLLGLAETMGFAGIAMMIFLTGITTIAAITTGSGNAPFYAFVELIPMLAAKMGINPAFLVVPMLQASNIGRTMSPVSGVVVACAGMGKLSPMDIIKRTIPPCLVALLIVIIMTSILVPLH